MRLNELGKYEKKDHKTNGNVSSYNRNHNNSNDSNTDDIVNDKKYNDVINNLFNQSDNGKNIKTYSEKNTHGTRNNENNNEKRYFRSYKINNDIDIKCREIAKLKTKGMIEIAQVFLCMYVCMCL
jgi:hypothetical protein